MIVTYKQLLKNINGRFEKRYDAKKFLGGKFYVTTRN